MLPPPRLPLPARPPRLAELLPFDAAKQQQLKEAIANSLNLGPGYDASNVEVRVVSVTGGPTGSGRRLRQLTVRQAAVHTGRP